MSTTELRWELEAVVCGEEPGYDGRERRAASALLKQIEGVTSDASVCVERDLHRVLATPENVQEQVREIERAQRVQEHSRARERSRSRERGMDLGLDIGM
jgi:hypothetical protein